MRRLESNNGETDQAYGLEPILADSDETVSFDEIVTHIRDVVDLQPSILEALSKSNVEMLKSLLVLWEEIPIERLRAVLENLVILTRNDRTFDFRAIFISTLRNKDIPVRSTRLRSLVMVWSIVLRSSPSSPLNNILRWSKNTIRHSNPLARYSIRL